MAATGSLATLMKEWPLNSVTLSAVTHSKLRKALDGTGTQVTTCMINRWTVKMNEVERYITTKVSQGEGGDHSSEDSWKLWPWSIGKPKRIRIYPQTQLEDKHLPLLHAFDDPAPSRSCQTVDETLTKAQFFTKFIVLGLLGLGSLTSTVKDLPNQDPTNTFL